MRIGDGTESSVLRFESKSSSYFFTEEGILTFNAYASRMVLSYFFGYAATVVILLILGLEVSVDYGIAWVIAVLTWLPSVRILRSHERRKIRKTALNEIPEPSRKRALKTWDLVSRIDLRQRRMTMKIGSGLSLRKESVKIDPSQFVRLKSLLEGKIGDRLTIVE